MHERDALCFMPPWLTKGSCKDCESLKRVVRPGKKSREEASSCDVLLISKSRCAFLQLAATAERLDFGWCFVDRSDSGGLRGKLAPALYADRVTKRYGALTALDGVSLSVEEAECVALIGESGSGKTTLLRCFNRLVVPDDGRVLIDGRDAMELDPISLRRQVGYVPQDGGLLPHWRVGRNVELVPRLRGIPDRASLADRALMLVGLEPALFRLRWPGELSGGQRQRVAVARALAAEPGVVLLDEPFGALDAITRADLQSAFADIRRELHTSALLVTHDLNEAFLLADRVVVLRQGRVEQAATPDELRRAPATEYVLRLLQRARMIPA
jgi:osmoprotectant transport system ATP-binding protein